MTALHALLVRAVDAKWREPFLVVGEMLVDGRFDRAAVEATLETVQRPDQEAVQLLAIARGVSPEALLATTMAGERVLWATLFAAVGLVPSEPSSEAVARSLEMSIERTVDEIRAAGDRLLDHVGELSAAVDERVRGDVADVLARAEATIADLVSVVDRITKPAATAIGQAA